MKKRIFILSFALVLLATWCYASYLYLPHRRKAFTDPAVPGGNDSYCILLLHFDGADTSTTMTDSATSSTGATITAIDNAQIDTGQTDAFGGNAGVLDCDGTGDYVTVADHAGWDFGTGNFTIDFWVNFDVVVGTNLGLFDMYIPNSEAAASRLAITINNDDNGLTVFVGGGENIATGNISLTTGQWYHIALVRQGLTSTKLYVDGTQSGSTYTGNYSVAFSDTAWHIGNWNTTRCLNGFMDEFRISNVARWAANFTPATSAY